MLMDQKVGYHLENFYAPVPNMMHYIRGASSRALYGCIQPKSLYISRAVELFSKKTKFEIWGGQFLINILSTGKSYSEALIVASTNQDIRFFIDL